MGAGAKGKIVQVIGTVVDVEFAPDELPEVNNGLEIDNEGERLVLEVEQHIGNNWVRCLALGPTEGLRRGEDADRHGTTHRGPGWHSLSRQAVQRHRRPAGQPGRGERGGTLANPPRASLLRGAGDQRGDAGDRHQGHRPDRPVYPRRQDRRIRRRRRGQDSHHPGAHPQHRQRPQGLLGVRRRGRALPRGQRPVARDAGVGRNQPAPCWCSAR